MKREIAMVGVGLTILSLSGCSEVSGGEAAPIPESSERISPNPSGNKGLPHSGAPAVTNPLPESVLAEHPCEVLTPQQIREILGEGVSEGERKDLAELGPGCDWSNPETLGGVPSQL